MDKLLLTTSEAAEVLNIGRSKVYDLIRESALASVKIGGSRRIPAAALQAYVDGLAIDGIEDGSVHREIA